MDLTNLIPGRNKHVYDNAQPVLIGAGMCVVIQSFEPVPAQASGNPNTDNNNGCVDANEAFSNDLVGQPSHHLNQKDH